MSDLQILADALKATIKRVDDEHAARIAARQQQLLNNPGMAFPAPVDFFGLLPTPPGAHQAQREAAALNGPATPSINAVLLYLAEEIEKRIDTGA